MMAKFNINSMKQACDTIGGDFRKQTCEIDVGDYTVLMTSLSNSSLKVDVVDNKGDVVGSSFIDKVTDIMFDSETISVFNKEDDNLTISKHQPFVDSDLV